MNWVSIGDELGGIESVGIARSPAGISIYAAFSNRGVLMTSDSGDNWRRAGWTGLFKSSDGGQNWIACDSGIESPVLVRSLAIHPAHAEILYAGTEGNGMYRSVDGGATWRVTGER